MVSKIAFTLNGCPVEIKAEPLKRLLDILREECGLTGVKEGCGEGECGACSILVEGQLVNSCLYPAGKAEGKEVVTIEGFRTTKRYEVLKEAFEEAGAVQCGFCSPGMLMAAESLLRRQPKPTEQQIREGISGNLCRCTGYNMIVEAILQVFKGGMAYGRSSQTPQLEGSSGHTGICRLYDFCWRNRSDGQKKKVVRSGSLL